MNKCWERSSFFSGFRFDFAFNFCYEFPLRFSGCWNNIFGFFSLVLTLYEYGWWFEFELCRLELSRGILYLVGYGRFLFYMARRYIVFGSLFVGIRGFGTSKEECFIWKRHFAITADMEDIEEIQILQDYIGQCGECNGLRCRFMISNVIVFGTGTLACRLVCVTLRYFLTWQGLDFFEHVTGVWCLGMWTDQHRSLYESCVTMD